jgi:hypothetical protein
MPKNIRTCAHGVNQILAKPLLLKRELCVACRPHPPWSEDGVAWARALKQK